MNLNGIVRPRDSQERVSFAIKSTLNSLLSLLGVSVFWLFMAALISSPLWVPALVNRLLSR